MKDLAPRNNLLSIIVCTCVFEGGGRSIAAQAC